MRRITVLSVAAALALTTAAPATAAASGDARPSDATDVEVLRLACAARATDAGPAVTCEWSEPNSSSAAGIKLFRLDPAVDDHRRVVYRSHELGTTSFTDAHVRRGHRYAYAVVAVDVNGRLVARSRAEWVHVPSDADIEVLRLQCELGRAHEAVGCSWSRPRSHDAAVVTLWRSVNGGEREIVERFRPGGPTTYRDRVPANATHIVYAVIATSESDRIVGRSQPVHVRIRPSDVVPTDVAPTDRARTDTAGRELVAP